MSHSDGSDAVGDSSVRPLVLGFVRAEGLPTRTETALNGALASWAHREGYLLGVIYRELAGNGAFDSLLQAIKTHDAVGVVVPDYAHLGPTPEARVTAVRNTGRAAVYAISPTPAPGHWGLDP
jgi:hypothetical protein